MPHPSSPKSETTPLSRATRLNDLSLHDSAVYDTWIKMLNDSFDNSKEFCKLMIIISMSAIPIYLYLLVFALPQDSNLGLTLGILLLMPAIIFLLSAVIFSIGFIFGKYHVTLNSIEDVENMKIEIIHHRKKFIILATLVFTLGALAAMAVIVKAHL